MRSEIVIKRVYHGMAFIATRICNSMALLEGMQSETHGLRNVKQKPIDRNFNGNDV